MENKSHLSAFETIEKYSICLIWSVKLNFKADENLHIRIPGKDSARGFLELWASFHPVSHLHIQIQGQFDGANP